MLPRALFGCDLWNNINNTDMMHLEATHHYCLKRIQSLPHFTRSDMVTGLLGFTTLEAYIDYQKLSFLGTLCRLKPDNIAFKVFLHRLYQQNNSCTKVNIGFLPDIKRILNKYSLYHYLQSFTDTTSFPDKALWKRICKINIFQSEQNKWLQRMTASSDFDMFRSVQSHLTPANIWRVAVERNNTLELMTFMAKLCCEIPQTSSVLCRKCNSDTTDEFHHLLFECATNQIIRKTYYELLKQNLSIYVANKIRTIPDFIMKRYILGLVDKNLTDKIPPNMYADFMCLNANFLKLIYA